MTLRSFAGTARVLGAVGLTAALVALIAVALFIGLALFCMYRRPRQLLNFLQARVDPGHDTPEMKVKVGRVSAV